MPERFPGILKRPGLSPANILKLLLPVMARRRAGFVNDKNLNVWVGSIFRILVAVQREVCADVAQAGKGLQQFANGGMVKAKSFAANGDQAPAASESAK